MKARIPKHREFVIDLENTAEEKREECWEKLEAILEDYKKEGKSVYTPTFIEDNEDKVKALQQEYGFAYTIGGLFCTLPAGRAHRPVLTGRLKAPQPLRRRILGDCVPRKAEF